MKELNERAMGRGNGLEINGVKSSWRVKWFLYEGLVDTLERLLSKFGKMCERRKLKISDKMYILRVI